MIWQKIFVFSVASEISFKRTELGRIVMQICSKAPLRIGFSGGGTDVPPYPEKEGGCLLNAAINRYASGSLTPRREVRLV
jgi:hypothetical protein